MATSIPQEVATLTSQADQIATTSTTTPASETNTDSATSTGTTDSATSTGTTSPTTNTGTTSPTTNTGTTSPTTNTGTTSPTTNTGTTATNPSPTPHGPNTGEIAGGVVGGLFFVAFVGFLAYFIYRRRLLRNARTHNPHDIRIEGGGLREKPDATTDIPSQGQVAWHQQPKDDEEMLHLFREIDVRLTDHVFDFYVDDDGTVYDDEISKLSNGTRQEIESRVSMLTHLLPRQDSRMFVLRAIIASRVIRAAIEKVEGQRLAPGGTYDSDYRDHIVLSIAKTAHDETTGFSIANSHKDARLHSMEAVVGGALDFAVIMARQPSKFEFTWALPKEESSSAVFDPRTMEAVHKVPREEPSATAKARATVFPGLRKWRDGKEVFLAKTQVLLY